MGTHGAVWGCNRFPLWEVGDDQSSHPVSILTFALWKWGGTDSPSLFSLLPKRSPAGLHGGWFSEWRISRRALANWPFASLAGSLSPQRVSIEERRALSFADCPRVSHFGAEAPLSGCDLSKYRCPPRPSRELSGARGLPTALLLTSAQSGSFLPFRQGSFCCCCLQRFQKNRLLA